MCVAYLFFDSVISDSVIFYDVVNILQTRRVLEVHRRDVGDGEWVAQWGGTSVPGVTSNTDAGGIITCVNRQHQSASAADKPRERAGRHNVLLTFSIAYKSSLLQLSQRTTTACGFHKTEIPIIKIIEIIYSKTRSTYTPTHYNWHC